MLLRCVPGSVKGPIVGACCRSQGETPWRGFKNLPECLAQASFTAEQVPAVCIWWDGVWADQPQVSATVRERSRPTEPPFSLLKGFTSRELVKRGPALQFALQGHLSPHAHAFLPLVKA